MFPIEGSDQLVLRKAIAQGEAVLVLGAGASVASRNKKGEALDARTGDEIDQYPLVTLANLHIGTLVHHRQTEPAKAFAKVYFDRLQVMERRINSERLTAAKERLFKYVTLEEWDTQQRDSTRRRGPISRSNHPRRSR